MDFIDDEVESSQTSNVLVPSSQSGHSTVQRSRKRRRLDKSQHYSEDHDSHSEADEYDLPSNEAQEDNEDLDNPKSKYDPFMHIPTFAETQQDAFVTQVDQPWSSPTAIRGPRWRKDDGKSVPQPCSPESPIHARPAIDKQSLARKPQHDPEPIVLDEFDDEDAELIEALVAEDTQTRVLLSSQAQSKRTLTASKSMRQTTLFGINTSQRDGPASTQNRKHNWPMANRNEPPTHHKIDEDAMRTWTYPLNVGTIRDYQFNIVYRALFNNILVALPTGLGKTFIAATVMLNYYNWTKDAQLVFVAPTKPLVTQQVDACFRIAGIPRSQTTLLTGEIQPAIRAEEWQEKRVFFMTPQTLINDLKTGMADPKKIVLLVVDEAHKATGNYAYVEVVRFLRRFNSSFRVLALTATPGASVEAVQKVIDGLDIARVEIRTEESMDIRSFVHTRNENVELFDNSEEIEMCLDLFATAVRPVLAKVNSLNAYFSNDPKTMTLYGLMKGREQWAKSDAGRKADWGMKGMVNSCFKPLMSLAHNLELLKFHGIGPFYHKMRVFDDEAHSSGKYARQIAENESYKKMMNLLKAWVNQDGFVGHPKLAYLNEVVLNHFMDAGSGIGAAAGRPPSDTRIMVFAHYRDSAEEIVRVLNRHQPMVRAHVFVGQSSTKGSDGMDQKTQIDIIKKFKAGTYNTLIATSIGEEGLDIGEVDLIVCYDCSKSPIRMLQRMGRTGRKRAGNIVLLLMRGKEERDYHSAKDNYSKMQAIIESGKDFDFHDDASPRIIPKGIQPVADKRHVEIPFENTQGDIPEPRRRKAKNAKRPPKKFHMPDNVEVGFQFLGSKKTSKLKEKKSRERPTWDQELASLPSLGRVLLSAADEQELESRYTQIAGEETQFVQAVRFDAFPERMRRVGKTKLVKPSIATENMVKASRAMRNRDKDWQRPSESNLAEAFEHPTATRSKTLDRADRGRATNVPASSTADAGESSSSANEYDLDDDFVDDGPVRQMTSSQQLSQGDEIHESQEQEGRDALLKVPFYVSQQSVLEVDSEAEELPDMDLLLGNVAAGHVRVVKPIGRQGCSTVPAKPKKALRGRKVLSDDSDEDEG